MRRFAYILVLLLISILGFGKGKESAFLKAEKLYKANKFEEALVIYNAEIKAKRTTKNILYNIGNCYFKLNKIGLAIAYYEKAKKLDPADKDILANLRFVNAKTEDKINSEDKGLSGWFNRFTHTLTPDSWSNYGIIFWIVGFMTFAIIKLNYLTRKYIGFAWLTFMLGILFTSFGFIHYRDLARANKAVIIEGMVQVKANPSNTSKNLYILHEGAMINLNQTRENWLEVSVDNDNFGWIRREEAEII